MEKSLTSNINVAKETLNDISNYFELSLANVQGLHKLAPEECLFLTQEELMANAIITINSAINGDLNPFKAFVTIIECTNGDLREDDLWLKLLLEKEFLVKYRRKIVKRNLLEYLLDLAELEKNEDIDLIMVKFIKSIDSLNNDIRDEIGAIFANSGFFKERILKFNQEIRGLLNKVGVKEKLLLQNKPSFRKRKYLEVKNAN